MDVSKATGDTWKSVLAEGVVIPACPLALTAHRTLDEQRQRALLRYYAAAGAGGIAIGVHTTQFAIREPRHNLFTRLLTLAADELKQIERSMGKRLVRIAGVCGRTEQAVAEASLACEHGYQAGLLTLAAMRAASDPDLIKHCETIAGVIPLFGFYLQPAVGGRLLSHRFWRRFAEIPNLVAVKIAPFNRYQTLDVVRAIAEAGRDDVALYTGNDDNIILDLLTPFRFRVNDRVIERSIVGGLLGQWAVWTSKAVELLAQCRRALQSGNGIPGELLTRNTEMVDANAAIFDAANNFAGCIPGIHYVLRRQGLLLGEWCLDPKETLSAGQRDEIERVYKSYPHLNDDPFVHEKLAEWLR
jgi:hypothetical protein